MKIIINIVLIFFPILIYGQLNIVSWNLKDFGQSRDEAEMDMIAEELRNADIIVLQEVVAKHVGGAQAVVRLKSRLNMMGSKWDSALSDPTNSSSGHKSERYAILWKTSKVKVTNGGPRLVADLEHYIEREPYVIDFLYDDDVITLVNYHACTHTPEYPERNEIIKLSRWLLKQCDNDVIWMGDMNLVIDDIAFQEILSNGYKSALNGEKTSLKNTCKEGNYLSRAEDNVLHRLEDHKLIKATVLDFIAKGDCHDVEWKRNSYSDHLPIEIVIDKSN